MAKQGKGSRPSFYRGEILLTILSKFGTNYEIMFESSVISTIIDVLLF